MAFLEVKQKLLREIESLGFSRARAARALHVTGEMRMTDDIRSSNVTIICNDLLFDKIFELYFYTSCHKFSDKVLSLFFRKCQL